MLVNDSSTIFVNQQLFQFYPRTIPESPRTSPQQDFTQMDGVNGPPLPPFADPRFNKDGNQTANSTTRELPTVNELFIMFERLDYVHCMLSGRPINRPTPM